MIALETCIYDPSGRRAKLRNELEKQRNILASAMGLSPDYCVDGGFYVVGSLTRPVMNMALCDLEMQAMRSRPEAFESGLTHLNSTNDLKRAIIKYLPKATTFWRVTRDKDRISLQQGLERSWSDGLF